MQSATTTSRQLWFFDSLVTEPGRPNRRRHDPATRRLLPEPGAKRAAAPSESSPPWLCTSSSHGSWQGSRLSAFDTTWRVMPASFLGLPSSRCPVGVVCSGQPGVSAPHGGAGSSARPVVSLVLARCPENSPRVPSAVEAAAPALDATSATGPATTYHTVWVTATSNAPATLALP